jgi:hypothetical protein
MSLSFGRTGLPFELATQDRSFVGAPPHAGVPIPDQDLGIMQRILADRFSEFVKRMFTAGWLSKGALAGGESIVSMVASQALVDGREVHLEGSFTSGGEVTLGAAGGSARYDLIFVEFWIEVLTYVSTVYTYGNVDYYGGNFANDLADPDCHHPDGDETTARLQLRYRTRYLEDATVMSDVDCYVQGKKANPDTGEHWTFDPVENIWYCNGGTDFDDLTGYVFALPICLAYRPASDDTISIIYDLRDSVHVKLSTIDPAPAETDDLIMEDTDVIAPTVDIWGLEVQQNPEDPDTAIDIGIGSCVDDSLRYVLALTTGPLTGKSFSEEWSVGSNGGLLDSGSSPEVDRWYRIYLIRQDIGGAIDVIASTSYVDPDLPGGWSAKRMIREIYIDANGDILPDIQWGDRVYWKVPPMDISTDGLGTTAALFKLDHVPDGYPVMAILNLLVFGDDLEEGEEYAINVTSPMMDDVIAVDKLHADASPAWVVHFRNNLSGLAPSFHVLTDQAAQIRARLGHPAEEGDICTFHAGVVGYTSPRGRLMVYASGSIIPS